MDSPERIGSFVQLVVWLLGVVALLLTIGKQARRNPPVGTEIEGKVQQQVALCDRRFTGLHGKVERLDAAVASQTHSMHHELGAMRRDIDAKLRDLGQQGASQERAIEMINQRQIAMDGKLDAMLKRSGT